MCKSATHFGVARDNLVRCSFAGDCHCYLSFRYNAEEILCNEGKGRISLGIDDHQRLRCRLREELRGVEKFMQALR